MTKHWNQVVGAVWLAAARLVAVYLVAVCFMAVCFALAGSLHAAESVAVEWPKLRDVQGEPVKLADGTWKVVCFLGTECPLAKLYGPRLNQLSAAFEKQGVQFVGINSNSQDSVDDVRSYVEEHQLTFPVIKDDDQRLADKFEATRTPEVFVVDPVSTVRYQGRIDDQYEPGQARTEPTRHDLRDALTNLLAGVAVQQPKTTAVGCLITRVRPPQKVDVSVPRVTFTRDVAPVLNRHCVECHREGEIGPFALTDYDEVVGWAQMMVEVVDQRRMPPWHADPRYGKFVGQREMPAKDRETLAAWVAQGMPQGNPSDLPPSPAWSAGWHLAEAPDLIIPMRDRPYSVPAEGVVDYQYFVVDPQWTEDHWIRAAQVIPGDPRVVHHAIVFVRPPDGTDSPGTGWMGAYVPGQRTAALPPGHARRVPAGSKLVFQMHYTPQGRATTDVTRVGVWFSRDEEVTHEVFTRIALDHDFEIPPWDGDFQVRMQLDGFANGARLLGATPHMHLRGKSFQLEVARRGERETLLSVPHYDFNWQHWYLFETPLPLDDVDALEMSVGFDNSKRNPVNPAPDEYVTWGDQTWEEMAVAFFDIALPRGAAREPTRRRKSEDATSTAERARLAKERTDKFLADMDTNRDGVVTREEAPLAFRRFGFRQFDSNGDGRLDRAEIEQAAAQRW